MLPRPKLSIRCHAKVQGDSLQMPPLAQIHSQCLITITSVLMTFHCCRSIGTWSPGDVICSDALQLKGTCNTDNVHTTDGCEHDYTTIWKRLPVPLTARPGVQSAPQPNSHRFFTCSRATGESKAATSSTVKFFQALN